MSKIVQERRLSGLLDRLDDLFGEVTMVETTSILEKAVYLIVREGDTPSATRRAMKSLMQDFVDWNEVRASRPSELARMMTGSSKAASHHRMVGRARRIKELLDQVYNDRNEADLDFVQEMKMQDQLEYLEDLDDLGIHNAYALLQWVLGTEKLVLPCSPAAKVALKTGVLKSAAVIKARKDLGELCPPSRYVALQAHLTELGELEEDDEFPAALQEYVD
ncbi:MAG: hypothetical protein VX916_02070 [Planctomycetota bacterium]|nr:hypothetical protein [Planctomycetota bacterium]